MDNKSVDSVDKSVCCMCGDRSIVIGLCQKCINKARKYSKKGLLHPNWRGESSKKDFRFRSPAWEKLRKEAYKRDNYMCQICGVNNIKLHAHHILPYRVGGPDTIENIITLCHKCHKTEEVKGYKRFPKNK